MAALYLTTDLLFSSRVRSAAEAQNLQVDVFMSPATLIERAGETEYELAILDLTAPGCDPAAIVGQLREAAPNMKVLAYGPHVQEARLAAARDAGCDEVLSNGQFHSRMGEVLGRYLGG